MTECEKVICKMYLEDMHDNCNENRLLLQMLEAEPCDDEYIKIPRKALKYRTAGMVAYNAEWLKKNWQMEMDIVCGVKPCDDVVSRQAVFDQMYEWMNTCEYRKVNATDYFVNQINKLPSVRPQEQTGMSDAVLEHYKKLAEHYNGGKHESIQDTDDGK